MYVRTKLLTLTFVFLTACGGDPTWEEFTQELVAETCHGLYTGQYWHPWNRQFTRFSSETECTKKLHARHFDRNWSRTENSVGSGRYGYSAIAAGDCIDTLADKIGNGALNWMTACPDVLEVEDRCDTWPEICHSWECENENEWDFVGCASHTPTKRSGARCVLYTDDGWATERCRAGETCLEESSADDLVAYGFCDNPKREGERCKAGSDCKFGLRCDSGRCR